MRSLVAALVAALGAAACGAESRQGAGGGGGEGDPCPAPAIVDEAGACVVLGVESCPEGFEPTVDAGCAPVLPVEPCPPGMMALPGDAACREIMPCGEGPWGEVPIEPGPVAPGVVYVDQAYAGADAPDGSAERPHLTIVDGMLSVGEGGQVVIAAGHYVERLSFGSKLVRMWGRCPALVRVTGTNAANEGTVRFVNASSGQELHGVRVDGPGFGIVMTNAVDVLLDRVWVTETAASGIVVDDQLGPASLLVVDSLVEAVVDAGILVGGAELAVERSEVRDIQAGVTGVGVGIGGRPAVALPTWSVLQSLIHRTVGLGVGGLAAELSVTESAILDVAPIATTQADGHGIVLTPGGVDLDVLRVSRTTITRTHDAGVATSGVAVHLDEVTTFDIFPEVANGFGGVGVALQSAPEGVEPMLVERSSIADTPGFGAYLADVDAIIDRTVMRRAQPIVAEDIFGDGAIVVSFDRRASLALFSSRLENNARSGVSSFAADLEVSGSVFECNAFDIAMGATEAGEAMTSDLGGNRCGCGESEAPCKAVSPDLAPPSAL